MCKHSEPAVCVTDLETILDSLDAVIYVADMETYDMLYMNEYGKQKWGEFKGRKCYEVMQKDQSGPCNFCPNHHLVDEDGTATGPFVWEIKNSKTGRWYQCRDQAIRWTDGRLVRLEIATDITDRKQMEEELKQAMQRAETLANTDELTGLYNRRAFFTMGGKILSYAERVSEDVSLIMFDADHFKKINDRYGHSVGDMVLVTIAETIQPLVRNADIIARIGGEEFAVLMLGTKAQQAHTLAERLREAISLQKIQTDSGDLHCTASFGISSTESCPYSLERLLSQADNAMYAAKSRGRNQVVEAMESADRNPRISESQISAD